MAVGSFTFIGWARRPGLRGDLGSEGVVRMGGTHLLTKSLRYHQR